ncbi:GPH family glycoside/pentoside/hexuronide:cation symporter [Sporomusaceae bacterium BoRhaA]|uniref:glycoside-pentoside-hexuronide (GPH):cation symporter n=1 Tax=Pelorhabdus rhamnosifermentans TaxID=2772457 RepID=UPI001C064994|nr:glycoside-pentoside-hexuronide (GPH):cation symporter [Pelorhabdus rhamnosifermentans]MBU2699105.1 GPH family glycoside/pentoside/hexuronide:cation symporter [Pelorhabdus rhamnosifermentans]
MNILSRKEKIGYGLGDAASHIVFDNVMLYMMFFYTDIFGIPAAFVGTMFLMARGLDAISDPIMGLIADRTKTRWGQFRPYLLIGAIPFGLSCILVYSTPDFGLHGKMIFAAITYTLLMLLYTMVNIPYCALGGVITAEPVQRMSLQSYRFVLATAGGMLSTVLMTPLAQLIGGNDRAWGYQGGIAVLATLAGIMLLVCFSLTKERVANPEPSKSSMRKDLRNIVHNDQWRIVGVLTLLNIMAVSIRGGSMMYYVTYILGNASYFTAFLATYSVGNLLGSALAKPVTDHICKVTVFYWTNLTLAILSLGMFFIPMNTAIIMFVFIFIIGILHQLITPIQWVMMSDTVEYGEWKYGKRLTGISFAGTLFVLKLGLALGGALIGWMLAGVDYQAGAATQAPLTLQGIVALFTIVPALTYFISAFISRSYTLRSDFMNKILIELKLNS